MTLIKTVCMLCALLSQCQGIPFRNNAGKTNMKMTVDSHPMLASVFSVMNNVKMIEQQQKQLGHTPLNGAVKGAGMAGKPPVRLEKKKFDLFPGPAGGMRAIEAPKKIKDLGGQSGKSIIGGTANSICRYCQKIKNVTCTQIYCFNQAGTNFAAESQLDTNNAKLGEIKPDMFPGNLQHQPVGPFPDVGFDGPVLSARGLGRDPFPANEPSLFPAHPLNPVPNMGQSVPAFPVDGRPHAQGQPMFDNNQFVNMPPSKAGSNMDQFSAPFPINGGRHIDVPINNDPHLVPTFLRNDVRPIHLPLDNDPLAKERISQPAVDMGQLSPSVPAHGGRPIEVPLDGPVGMVQMGEVGMGQISPGFPADVGRHIEVSFSGQGVNIDNLQPAVDMGQVRPTFPADGVKPVDIPRDNRPIVDVNRAKPPVDIDQIIPTFAVNDPTPHNIHNDLISLATGDLGQGHPVMPPEGQKPDSMPLGDGVLVTSDMGHVNAPFPHGGRLSDTVQHGNGQMGNVNHLHAAGGSVQGNPGSPVDGHVPQGVPFGNDALIPIQPAEPFPVELVPLTSGSTNALVEPVVNGANSMQQGNTIPNAISFDNEFRAPNPSPTNKDIIQQQPIDGAQPVFPHENTMEPLFPADFPVTNLQPEIPVSNNQQGSLESVQLEAMRPLEGIIGIGDVNNLQGQSTSIADSQPDLIEPSIVAVIAGARAFDVMNPLTSDGGSEQLPTNIGQFTPNRAVVSSAQGFQELKPHLGDSGMQGPDLFDGQMPNPPTSNIEFVQSFPRINAEHVGVARVAPAQGFQDLKPHSRMTGREQAELASNQLLSLLSGNSNDAGPVSTDIQQVGPIQSGVQVASAQGFHNLKPHSRLSGIQGPMNDAGVVPNQRGTASTGMNKITATNNGFVNELGQPITTFSELNQIIKEVQIADQVRNEGIRPHNSDVRGDGTGRANGPRQEMVQIVPVPTTTLPPPTPTIVTISPQRRAELDAFFGGMMSLSTQ